MGSNPVIAELKACPHCGSEQIAVSPCQNITDDAMPEISWAVICKACAARVDRGTEESAIAAWNTRVSTPPPAFEPEAADRGVSEAERIGPLQFERPVGRNFEEWCANVRKGDLYRRGDTVLVWVNEGDIIAHQMALQALRSEQEDGR